jgi:hypothetical protein
MSNKDLKPGELWLEFFRIAVLANNQSGTRGYEKAQVWLNSRLKENNLPADINLTEASSQCREVVYWLEKFEDNFICEKRSDFENQKENKDG